MLRLADAAFVAGAAQLADLPPDHGWEVAFTGRSNAGKSTALNALTGKTGLARVSKTPGRTQQLNVFALDAAHRLVDLPGYGYARAPEAVRAALGALVSAYLRRRRCLKALVLLADIRRGLNDDDRALLTARGDLSLLVLLSKADKVGRGERARQTARVREEAPQHARVLAFSAREREGIEIARAWVLGFLGETP